MGELDEDPFLYATRAIEHTSSVVVGTSVAIALARSPMNIAYLGFSLNKFATGRFILGLGSQVKTQIEDRFSMPWGKPAARMAEYVTAVSTSWSAWQQCARLNFNGEFYRHTSMEPLFTPAPSPYSMPKICLGAVNREMLRTAASVADGLILMLTPPRYLHEVILPIVEERLAATNRQRSDFEICLTSGSFTGVFPVETKEELKTALDRPRSIVPYYFSVPTIDRCSTFTVTVIFSLRFIRFATVIFRKRQMGTHGEYDSQWIAAIHRYVCSQFANSGDPKAKVRKRYHRFLMGGEEAREPWGTPDAMRSSLG